MRTRKYLFVLIIFSLFFSGCEKEKSDYEVLFLDDFETYTVGIYPMYYWVTRFGGVSAVISDSIFFGGSKSFELESLSNWSRVETIPLEGIPDFLSYEGCIYIDQPDKGYVIGLGFKENSYTYRWSNAFQFSNDGKLYISGKEYAIWEAKTWYKIRLDIDFSQMIGTAYLNGSLISETVPISSKSEIKDFTICGCNFSTGTSKAYFDNIRIREIYR